ncbi:MAG: copper chaperone PCu(A)C [Actinomycetota bacterium]
MRTRTALVALAVVMALLAASCGSPSDEITVDDPWVRATPPAAAATAFYMTIKGSDTADRLVSAESAACGTVEIHETVMEDDVMKMQHLPNGIEIPAGGEAKLEPGGLHVMCIGKLDDFTVGNTIALTLVFETSESQTVDAEIREG